MQLLGVPDRLQENSIYLHTIYQLSSIDGLILTPCSSPTSRCNESLLQGIAQGLPVLHQVLLQTRSEERSVSAPQIIPKVCSVLKKPPASLCLVHKKIKPTCNQDSCSITLMFCCITLFHALSHNEDAGESGQIPLGV